DRRMVMMTRSDASARSGRVRLSDARTGVPVAAPLPVDATAIRVNRSGSRVLVAGGDGRISVLTLRTPAPNVELRGGDESPAPMRTPPIRAGRMEHAMLQARFSRDRARVPPAPPHGTAPP